VTARLDGGLDEALVRALYEEHAGPLLGYVMRLTGDRGFAEDVVQETLLRAWRNPETLRGDRPVRPWLWTVARHLVVDQWRARQARPPEVPGELLEGDSSAAVGDGVDEVLLSWEVASALDQLTPDHRAVLVETYYRGKSVAEAAKVLGVPPGTVKSRTYYALRALRLVLQERGLV
jgi:RNA polymerase sigma-70 factor, ECF subfamily